MREEESSRGSWVWTWIICPGPPWKPKAEIDLKFRSPLILAVLNIFLSKSLIFYYSELLSLSWWRICLQCRRPRFNSWVRKIRWKRDRLPTAVFLSFPCGSAGKESACNAGDLSLIPGLGRSPGGGKGYPLQYSGLENSMNCIVHGVAKSRIQLRD